MGRLLNVLGEAIDEGEGQGEEHAHPPSAPSFEEQRPATEILETGIKVIDLLAPYSRGGKVGLLAGGVGKTVLIMEPIRTSPMSTAAFPSSPAWVRGLGGQ